MSKSITRRVLFGYMSFAVAAVQPRGALAQDAAKEANSGMERSTGPRSSLLPQIAPRR